MQRILKNTDIIYGYSQQIGQVSEPSRFEMTVKEAFATKQFARYSGMMEWRAWADDTVIDRLDKDGFEVMDKECFFNSNNRLCVEVEQFEIEVA